MNERSYLLRCLVGLLAADITIGGIDLAACRFRTPSNCDPQSSAVYAAVGSAGAGIFYLCYTVPTKLDDVLSNQQLIQKKLGDVEDKVMDHDVRLIKLELRR
jgi:hypothetical protein